MLSRVIAAPRIYMQHRGLGENFGALGATLVALRLAFPPLLNVTFAG